MTLARLIEAFPALASYALLFARILPLAALSPLLGLAQMAPGLRTMAALALAIGVAPAIPDAAVELGPKELFFEVLTGAYFALIASLPLFGLSMAGRLVDQARGVSQPGERDLVEREPSSALGQLHAVAGIAVFFALGAHRHLLRAFADGLEAVPLGAARLSGEVFFGFATLAGKALLFGVSLALPALAAVLLVEIFLGLLSRVATTLPVFHAGMPARAFAGLFAVLLVFGLGIGLLRDELGHAIALALASLSEGP